MGEASVSLGFIHLAVIEHLLCARVCEVRWLQFLGLVRMKGSRRKGCPKALSGQ